MKHEIEPQLTQISHIDWQINTNLSAELFTSIYGDKRRNKIDKERLCVCVCVCVCVCERQWVYISGKISIPPIGIGGKRTAS